MISVIIPVYKVEQYLDECVQSVLNQTYRNLEIILVDDGSPDNCPLMCDNYAALDNRIKVIHKKNGGLSSARNAAIDIATGEYFIFIDSDDYIAEDMIEQLWDMTSKNNFDIAVCNYTSDFTKLNSGISQDIKHVTPKEAIKQILIERGINTSASTKLFHRKLFSYIRFPEGMIYEDYATIYKLIFEAETIGYANTYKYFYRVNNESITNATFSAKQMDYYKVSSEVYGFIVNKHPEYKHLVVNRETRMSIALYRKISASGYYDAEIIKFLVNNIRKNIFRYLFTQYATLSKLYGILICILPRLALKVFKR